MSRSAANVLIGVGAGAEDGAQERFLGKGEEAHLARILLVVQRNSVKHRAPSTAQRLLKDMR